MSRVAPEQSLDDHVRKAVAQTICACVLEIEDDVERHLSGTHAGILDEVRRQVELRVAEAARVARDDPVVEASEESFPASDPKVGFGNFRSTGSMRSEHMVMRTSIAKWHGRVQDGRGSVRLGSGAFEGPYSFGPRFEEQAGTNPEELLGAAHASCFTNGPVAASH